MAGKRALKQKETLCGTFADELSMYIGKSGMTIQKLSAVTGLGRTAIQHMLAGKLIPARSFIDRLCAALPMTPEQKEELIERYSREKAGDAVYYNRCRIKQIIESLPQYRISDSITRISSEKVAIPDCAVKTASGIANVNNLLRAALLKESHSPAPAITAALPFESSLFFEMLLQIFSASDKKLRLEHYFSMNTCAEGEKNKNMDILQWTLKTAMCAAVDYSPYYHYISSETEESLLTPYPYFILTSDYSLLVSADICSAVLIDSAELREELVRYAERIKSRSSLMVRQVGQAEMFGLYVESAPLYSCGIEYQPCLTGYVTEDILLRRLGGDIPNRDEVIKIVREKFYNAPKQDSGHFRNYFTKEGLVSFAKTGKMTNMPGSLLMPMSREERIYFLEAMKKDGSGYVLLTEAFAIPSFMQVICLTNRSVIISCLTEEKKFCCLLTEPGLCGAFEDLCESLGDSGLTESVGILTAVIDSCIEMIKRSDEEIISEKNAQNA